MWFGCWLRGLATVPNQRSEPRLAASVPTQVLTCIVSAILMYVGCYRQDSLETDTSQYAAHFTAEQTEPAPPGEVNHNT